MSKKIDEKKEYSYMSETIKRRPVNKKKLFKKTLGTIVGAILFAVIACTVFLLLEPVINNYLYPEEIEKIQLPEDEEEVSPEEMLTDESLEIDEEMTTEVSEDMTEQIQQQIEAEASNGAIALQTYQTMYEELYAISVEASKCIVTVTAVTSGMDWFQNDVENINETSGVIIAETDNNIYLIADLYGLEDAEEYEVTLDSGTTVEATLRSMDSNTGLAALVISITALTKEDKDSIAVANLGNSKTTTIVGRPVMAIGSPLGQSGSICYGIVTSNSSRISYADYSYGIITTDMTGSEDNASGIIINTSGQLVGIITKQSAQGASGALLAAFGITDIKNLLEQLSNAEERVYLGIHGADVTEKIHQNQDIPYGVYVTEVDMSSPAMNNGITTGDIITSLGDSVITSLSDYQTALKNLEVDTTVGFTLYRYNGSEYVEISGEMKAEALQ